jgi:hypothetical protein
MINASDQVEAKNPLRYAQSLKDQNYSWVDVRPKGMIVMVESNWKAEMSSHEVDDPSIENSGSNLKAIEVDYRKNSDDTNTMVYFYRTREDALADAQAIKQQVESDAKTDAQLKAFDAEWSQKLTSLPYMVADHDRGFKLAYSVCKPTGRIDSKGGSICNEDDSYDWSDSRRSVPYHWFSDIWACEHAQIDINTSHPADVKVNDDDFFTSSCVPASKKSGYALKGYKMVFALSASGAGDEDNTYADLRESGARTARVFKTFNTCHAAVDTAYSKTLKQLGADEEGNLLSDKTKSISLTATCVRVY